MVTINRLRIDLLLILYLSFYSILGYTAENPREVELTFDWPADVNGVISTTEETTLRGNHKDVSSTVSRTAKITSERHADGLLLNYFDKEFEVVESTKSKETYLAKYPEDVMLMDSTAIVSPTGELLDLLYADQKIDRIRDEFKEFFKHTRKNMSDIKRQKLIDQFDSTLSKKSIFKVYRHSWNIEISQWNGLLLNMDNSMKVERRSRILLFDGAEAIKKGEYKFMGRSLCRPHHLEKRCVTVSYRSELTPKSVEFMNGLASSARGGAEATNSSDVLSIKLTADPETLLPYSIVQKHSSKSAIGPNGEIWMLHRKATTSFRYQ